MVYTVTFNPAIDYVVYISGGLKLNDINRNASEEFQFGGKGINVSNMLRTLGRLASWPASSGRAWNGVWQRWAWTQTLSTWWRA